MKLRNLIAIFAIAGLMATTAMAQTAGTAPATGKTQTTTTTKTKKPGLGAKIKNLFHKKPKAQATTTTKPGTTATATKPGTTTTATTTTKPGRDSHGRFTKKPSTTTTTATTTKPAAATTSHKGGNQYRDPATGRFMKKDDYIKQYGDVPYAEAKAKYQASKGKKKAA